MSPIATLLQDPASTPTTPEGGAAAPGLFGNLGGFFPILAVFAIFYFVLIGPERKKRKEREQMLGAIKKGQRVMTTGGMFATVVAVADDKVTLQIADGVRARFSVQSIQSVESDEEAPSEKK